MSDLCPARASGLPRLNEPRHSWLVRDGYLVRESLADAWSRPRRLRAHLPQPLLVLGVNAQQDGAADLHTVRHWNLSSVAESYVHTTLGTFPGNLVRHAAQPTDVECTVDPFSLSVGLCSPFTCATLEHFSTSVIKLFIPISES